VRVRDLSQRGITLAEQAEHLGEHGGGRVDAAVVGRDRQRQQAGALELLDLLVGQFAAGITHRRADGEGLRQLGRHRQCLLRRRDSGGAGFGGG